MINLKGLGSWNLRKRKASASLKGASLKGETTGKSKK